MGEISLSCPCVPQSFRRFLEWPAGCSGNGLPNFVAHKGGLPCLRPATGEALEVSYGEQDNVGTDRGFDGPGEGGFPRP